MFETYLEAFNDSYLLRAALVILGLSALTYPQWLSFIPGVAPGKFDNLAASLEALEDQLVAEAKAGRPPSLELSVEISHAMSDLQALKIPHPNWHGLNEMPILAWLPYVNKVLPALRRQNLREARDAINHVDMAVGLKP